LIRFQQGGNEARIGSGVPGIDLQFDCADEVSAIG
jgi:hypothetical protein